MNNRAMVLLALVGMVLACGGGPASDPVVDAPPEAEAPDGDPAETIARRWVDAELAGPDTGTPKPVDPAVRDERVKTVTAFVADHPEAQRYETVVAEYIRQTGGEAEASFAAVKADFAPDPPAQLEVSDSPWRVMCSYAFSYQTSEDWAWYSAESQTSAKGAGISVCHLEKGQHVVEARRDGVVVGTVELPEAEQEIGAQGYLFAEEGKPVQIHPHDMGLGVVEGMNDYYTVDVEYVPL